MCNRFCCLLCMKFNCAYMTILRYTHSCGFYIGFVAFFHRHTNQDKFNEAKSLVVNLAETVIKDLQTAKLQEQLEQHQLLLQRQLQETQQEATTLLFQHPPPSSEFSHYSTVKPKVRALFVSIDFEPHEKT